MPRNVGYTFQAQALLRQLATLRRQFGAGLVSAITAAHTDAAERVQERMAEELEQRVAANGRPQTFRDDHESGTLPMAVRHPKNRIVTFSGFTVGVPEWLDQSPARLYWRQVEQGGPERETRGLFYLPGAPVAADPTLNKWHGRFRDYGLGSRAPRARIGPFPAYRYLETGARFGAAMSMRPIYETRLKAIGLSFSSVARGK
jgi:hypothetical protein